MSEDKLRRQIIHLAKTYPEFRADLVPILRKDAAQRQELAKQASKPVAKSTTKQASTKPVASKTANAKRVAEQKREALGLNPMMQFKTRGRPTFESGPEAQAQFIAFAKGGFMAMINALKTLATCAKTADSVEDKQAFVTAYQKLNSAGQRYWKGVVEDLKTMPEWDTWMRRGIT